MRASAATVKMRTMVGRGVPRRRGRSHSGSTGPRLYSPRVRLESTLKQVVWPKRVALSGAERLLGVRAHMGWAVLHRPDVFGSPCNRLTQG
jgi:hypothetical protein